MFDDTLFSLLVMPIFAQLVFLQDPSRHLSSLHWQRRTSTKLWSEDQFLKFSSSLVKAMWRLCRAATPFDEYCMSFSFTVPAKIVYLKKPRTI